MRIVLLTFGALFTLVACSDGDREVVGDPIPVPTPADVDVVSDPLPPSTADGVPTQQVMLFGGRDATAKRYASPPEDSLEYAIMKSLMMIGAEEYDAWMDQFCHPDACDDERKREAMASHVLPAAKASAATCLHDGALLVTKQEVENGITKTWIYCGDARMPAPSSAAQVDGTWRFSSISW